MIPGTKKHIEMFNRFVLDMRGYSKNKMYKNVKNNWSFCSVQRSFGNNLLVFTKLHLMTTATVTTTTTASLPPATTTTTTATATTTTTTKGRNHGTNKPIQGGPLPVISRVVTPFIGGYDPSYPFIRPFIVVITPLITRRGPPCRIHGTGIFSHPHEWLIVVVAIHGSYGKETSPNTRGRVRSHATASAVAKQTQTKHKIKKQRSKQT